MIKTVVMLTSFMGGMALGAPTNSAPPQVSFPMEDIKGLIKGDLQAKVALSGDFEIAFDNQRIVIPRPTESDKLAVSEMTVADNQQTFEARLDVISGDQTIPVPQPIAGKIQPLTEVPVLTRAFTPGEEVTEADLTWQKIPSTRLSQTLLIRKDDIVGKTPISKVIQPSQLLYRNDFRSPLVIKKGEMATVHYRKEGLYLSSQAQALQDGSKGDMMRFMTPNKKEIQARAVGPHEAEIRPYIGSE